MKSTFTYDHLFLYEELTDCLKTLAMRYPTLMTLNSLNKTKEGRDIWEVEITNQATGSCEEKAAYYVDGNEHAGEVTGSMAAMYFVDYLLTNSELPEVKSLLDQYAFYVVPRKSPDGAEYYLTTPDTVRSLNEMYPFEELMPGLQPEDLDGDGVIRNMRVKTPFGAWKISEKDPRCMTRRQPDDIEGDFYNVYQEGRILEYDGAHIAIAPDKFGNDDNRNYPVSWAPENEQVGAGLYPLCHIETKTSADFVIAHKNIASVITFHTHGGMFLFPPGMCPSKEVFEEDMKRYKAIGKIATEETGFPVVNLFDEFTPEGVRISSGAFDDWCHYDRGIPAYTIECWDLKPRAGIPHIWPLPKEESWEKTEEDFMKQLAWVDENVPDNPFKPWTELEHPQLGTVEIGGFDYKRVYQNCPPAFLQEEVEKHTRFMLRHVKMLPKLQMEPIKAECLAEGIYRVSAVVGNQGYLPTYLTREAIKRQIANPVKATLIGAEVLEGKECQELGNLQGFSGIDTGYSFFGLYTGNYEPTAKKVSWIVRAKAGDRVWVCAEGKTAGTIKREILLP